MIQIYVFLILNVDFSVILAVHVIAVCLEKKQKWEKESVLYFYMTLQQQQVLRCCWRL